MSVEILQGDCREVLRTLPTGSVHCVVTSHPYWGLRRYSDDPREIGQEATIAEYLTNLVQIFTEVKRVLRKDGTLWVNMGDSYAAPGYGNSATPRPNAQGLRSDPHRQLNGLTITPQRLKGAYQYARQSNREANQGLGRKQLCGLPWRLAFALQDAGWILRCDIIWAKPNPLPESVKDRPTRSHEYVFLFSQARHYYYDQQAIAEPLKEKTRTTFGSVRRPSGDGTGLVKSENWGRGMMERRPKLAEDGTVFGANARSVWTIPPEQVDVAHFATFPSELARRCIVAGCPGDGTVLDPFAGSGTVLRVALAHGRHGIGIDLNSEYIEIQEARTTGVQLPLTAIQ